MRFFLSKTTTHSSLKNLCPSSLANFSVTQRLGVSVTFFWAFRFASGFPLYLCSLNWDRERERKQEFGESKIPKTIPRSQFPVPESHFPFRSQRMPLQSLTQLATSNELLALGKTAHKYRGSVLRTPPPAYCLSLLTELILKFLNSPIPQIPNSPNPQFPIPNKKGRSFSPRPFLKF